MPGIDFAHAFDESESSHFAHARRYIFAWPGPFHLKTKYYLMSF